MNKKILMGLVLLLGLGFLVTGCTKNENKELKCSKDEYDKSLEVYGTSSLNTVIPFNGKDKIDGKASIEVVLKLSKLDASDEKIKSISEVSKEDVCGDNGLITSKNCETKIDGKTITYSAKDDFNELWVNYAGEETLDEVKEFLENHEGMTCSIVNK